ncbi:hypothetical protein ACJ41O_013865 [Fusarium nematophilum]
MWGLRLGHFQQVTELIMEGFYDNPAAPATRKFLPKTGRGSIIITSRNADTAERLVGLDVIYNVPVMEKSQALQLFRNRLGEQCADSQMVMADLVVDLNNMPLAITQAAAYIRRRGTRMSISTYLNEFRKNDKKRASLLNKDAGDLRRDESADNSTVTTWQITFEQIRRERPSAADLLSFMSFFSPQGIPESALQTYARDDGEGVINAFIYMIVARLVHFLHPQRRMIGISAQWLAKLFVTADVMCFIIQAAGGVLIADQNSKDNAALGRKIYMAGAGVQLGCVAIFIVIHTLFYRVLFLNARIGKLETRNRWTKSLFWIVYLVLGLIIVRIIFRLVEFGQGVSSSNVILRHEEFPLYLDALPMLIAVVALNMVHPGMVLKGPECLSVSKGEVVAWPISGL